MDHEATGMLTAKIPNGPLEQKWSHYRSTAKLVSTGNRRKLHVIVVGTGLSGSSLAASLGEMGYQVTCFCFQDTARRAHSVAAQGGVNACKNYKNDGDTVFRMFYDTIKGGDFRSREANVYRLAECSAQLIDQAVAQGVPFAREYSGYLSNRSFGGVQVSRTFYARGQTGQQLLLGAYQALMRQVAAGRVQLSTRHEMLDLVTIAGKACGIIVRNMDTGALERHGGHAVVLATGGFGKIFYLSTLAMGCNASAIWRAHKRGAFCPRDIASRAAKERIDAGYGVGPLKNAVYLDFSKAISEQGKNKVAEKYGNLFRMYEKITGINAYTEPMRISPAAHFSMGGL